MVTRRSMLQRSAQVAGLMAAAGLVPATARAAWPQAAFEAKNLADAVKALGGSAPVESKDVTLTGPDIAENGAVVPVACACGLPGVKRLALLVDRPIDPPLQLTGKTDPLRAAAQARLLRFVAEEMDRGPDRLPDAVIAELEDAILVSYLLTNQHNYSGLLNGAARAVSPWQVRRASAVRWRGTAGVTSGVSGVVTGAGGAAGTPGSGCGVCWYCSYSAA